MQRGGGRAGRAWVVQADATEAHLTPAEETHKPAGKPEAGGALVYLGGGGGGGNAHTWTDVPMGLFQNIEEKNLLSKEIEQRLLYTLFIFSSVTFYFI